MVVSRIQLLTNRLLWTSCMLGMRVLTKNNVNIIYQTSHNSSRVYNEPTSVCGCYYGQNCQEARWTGASCAARVGGAGQARSFPMLPWSSSYVDERIRFGSVHKGLEPTKIIFWCFISSRSQGEAEAFGPMSPFFAISFLPSDLTAVAATLRQIPGNRERFKTLKGHT